MFQYHRKMIFAKKNYGDIAKFVPRLCYMKVYLSSGKGAAIIFLSRGGRASKVTNHLPSQGQILEKPLPTLSETATSQKREDCVMDRS